jgi:homoaconitase/3-isopropylmalate dehydratase large subunit
MFAFGAGGSDVALKLMGEPACLRMPAVMDVRLTRELPRWVRAKDIILEMLRRHGLEGGFGRVIEYYGPGLAQLSAMDRHVIANMAVEFTCRFLRPYITPPLPTLSYVPLHGEKWLHQATACSFNCTSMAARLLPSPRMATTIQIGSVGWSTPLRV